jgi:hypothetical protein
MPSLSKENRKLLENTVAAARVIAVKGATTVLRDQYAVGESAPWPHMSDLENKLRVKLRAHGRQLGDRRDPHRDTQELDRLAQACAYEHWHRMLFARFLAENDLLLDPDHGVAMTLEEIRELAQEQHRDWQELAAELAQRMLLAVFRPEDPVLSITLPPETRLQLEQKLALLPSEVFLADDSLGWVYQFWQRDEKDRVNKSEVKIGADELPAVTQLFTEDYMVLFLLENTLGAWWTAKRRAEGKDPALPGYTFTYLRLNEDGSPAAGSFDGWSRSAKELRILDPCMGSGHFLVFALPILARMRMEEEGLALKEALFSVLKDNLFGLELDARCAQIAAFNLALAAWRMAGEHFVMPELNLACCGIGPNTTKEQWIKLGEEIAAKGGMPANVNLFSTEDSLLSEPVKRTLESLHELFSQAPVLGSLIDPSKLRVDLFQSDYQTVAPLLSAVLKAENATEETRERVIAAAGMVKAAGLLGGKYTLVATNVPYLGIRKQCQALMDHCKDEFVRGRHDLATAFLERSLSFCSPGCSIATVAPQNWMSIQSYKGLRESILQRNEFVMIAALGTSAFEMISGEVVNVGLFVISQSRPTSEAQITIFDVSETSTSIAKSQALRGIAESLIGQKQQLSNPDSRIVLSEYESASLLGGHSQCLAGIQNGDSPTFLRNYWELPQADQKWCFIQTSVTEIQPYGGMDTVIDYDRDAGHLRASPEWRRGALHDSDQRGKPFWGRLGVLISRMGNLPATLYLGDLYDQASTAIVPKVADDVGAVFCYCSSENYRKNVRKLDRKVNVTSATLVKVPFDRAFWREEFQRRYPDGLPAPSSSDPTQWLFNGRPNGAIHPLQVAVARLIGYRWPRQTGSSFINCPALNPDGLEGLAAADGIVALSSVAGEASAADRLRALLAAAYGEEWSAGKLAELLGGSESLETWLRDRFFEEHCQLFQQHPFVWHVWDGRKDGFNALVNYHKLAAPKGEGRKTLEKLIYTTLGDWITRQRADVTSGIDGADGRLAAADHLKGQLEKILEGEKPYDIFVRWKPLDQQPIGWAPDINDGVRMNIRPWLTATPHQAGRRDGCILRVTPKIRYGKDRGKEPLRKKEYFPWFWTWDEKTDDFGGGAEFDGARWNDPHYSLQAKIKARNQKQEEQKQLEQASPARIGAAK